MEFTKNNRCRTARKVFALTAIRYSSIGALAGAVVGTQACAGVLNEATPLLRETDLVHVGAFRLPSGGPDQTTFSYGGRAIAYNPVRNTLFVVGHKHHQRTAEITIPEPIVSNDLNDLHAAEIIQVFSDPTEGRLRDVNPSDPNAQYIGGQLVYDGQLYVNVFSSYDGNGTQKASLFSRSTSLEAAGTLHGPFLVGSDAHATSAYMATVPVEWQQRLGGPVLIGNCCRSIIGNQSHGPSISVFDPAMPAERGKIDAERLIWYSSSRPLGPGSTTKNPLFNLTTRVDGVVFPNATRSLLFFGKHGVGDYCYGDAATCKDPAMTYKGTHAYPYVYQVWAYDVAELTGKQVDPYAVWQLSLPFESDGTHEIGGVAYDAEAQVIYLSQINGEKNAMPLIHVFRVTSP